MQAVERIHASEQGTHTSDSLKSRPNLTLRLSLNSQEKRPWVVLVGGGFQGARGHDLGFPGVGKTGLLSLP